MSQLRTQSRRDFKPKSDLSKIYRLNQHINHCNNQIKLLTFKREARGTIINQNESIECIDLQSQRNKLQLSRQDELIRVYSKAYVYRKPSTILELPEIVPKSTVGEMKVAKVSMTPTSAKIDMRLQTNKSRTYETVNNQELTITYPPHCKDKRPFDLVARYRQLEKKSNNINFVEEPLHVGPKEPETAVIGMGILANKLGCELICTNEAETFDDTVYRAACGISELGNIHLLTTDAKKTAMFIFVIDLDFKRRFQQSKEKVSKYTTDMCNEIANFLECDPNYIRIISISSADESKQATEKLMKKCELKVCLTTDDIEKTKALSTKLQDSVRIGFKNGTLLGAIRPGHYKVYWTSVVQTLKLDVSDFAKDFHEDYIPPKYSPTDTTIRGGKVYFFPFGWSRLALNVEGKYKTDKHWLAKDEELKPWNVAFHGTKFSAAHSIAHHGLKSNYIKRDAMRAEAVKRRGSSFDRPGFYVATKCEGGASLYATEFEVPTGPDQIDKFQLVFQCRVKPDEYTVHKGRLKDGDIWRFIDPAHIRPYGILLKKTA